MTTTSLKLVWTRLFLMHTFFSWFFWKLLWCQAAVLVPLAYLRKLPPHGPCPLLSAPNYHQHHSNLIVVSLPCPSKFTCNLSNEFSAVEPTEGLPDPGWKTEEVTSAFPSLSFLDQSVCSWEFHKDCIRVEFVKTHVLNLECCTYFRTRNRKGNIQPSINDGAKTLSRLGGTHQASCLSLCLHPAAPKPAQPVGEAAEVACSWGFLGTSCSTLMK